MRLSDVGVLIAAPDRQGAAVTTLLSLIARLGFAAVLLVYFLGSATTKFDGFGLSAGAYAQILPRQMEAVGYDPSQIAWPLHLLVLGGSLAEVVLPLLLVLGLLTRLASLGMIGFVLVMSATDIWGHGIDAAGIGALFDRQPDSLIADQRLLWIVMLAVPLLVGGGRVSLDRLLSRRLRG